MGIRTIGDLAHYNPAVLVETFGIMGTQLSLIARGIDRSEVEERHNVKSMSRETTFEEDTADFEFVLGTSDKLSEELHQDLLRQKLYFKTVTVKVRYENFETHITCRTLPFMTDRLLDLKRTARGLLNSYLRPGRKIRLIGVKASNFTSGQMQKTLV
jgi:DNA polymerase IV (DinB-like DNA polymerase)